MKISVCGTHGSGKSTLCYGLVSKLKKKSINAELVQEVARHSPFLIAEKQCPEAELQIFASQVEKELVAGLFYEVIVTDRTILDHIMYMELFHPSAKEFAIGEKEFAKHYIHTYDLIFMTSTFYDLVLTGDKLRPTNTELQQKASENLIKLLDEFYPTYFTLPTNYNSAIKFMLEKIEDRL